MHENKGFLQVLYKKDLRYLFKLYCSTLWVRPDPSRLVRSLFEIWTRFKGGVELCYLSQFDQKMDENEDFSHV